MSYASGKWILLAALAAGSVLMPETSWARGGRGRGGGGWGGGSWGGGRSGVYIGIGNGGYYGGYGRGGYYGGRGYYGGYGGGYYPNYGYSNGYSYPGYNSGTVIDSSPVYNSAPVISSTVVPNNPPMRTGGGDVIIENSAENASTVNYSLNGNNYTIQPGQTQRIANDRQWVVEFDRGEGQGTARYTLSEGRFRFKPTEQGWELMRAQNQAGSIQQNTAKPPLPGLNESPELNSLDAAPEPR